MTEQKTHDQRYIERAWRSLPADPTKATLSDVSAIITVQRALAEDCKNIYEAECTLGECVASTPSELCHLIAERAALSQIGKRAKIAAHNFDVYTARAFEALGIKQPSGLLGGD